MRTNTILGMSLGKMLSDAASGDSTTKGRLDAEKHYSDVNYKKSAIAKNEADAAETNQKINFGTDESLMQALLSGIGANSEQGQRDFQDSMAGSYKPPTQPLAFKDGGAELPAPDYVQLFPELQKKFSGLKQQLALGDKDLTHLSESIRGDQRNAATANIDVNNPENINNIARITSAIDGDNPLNVVQAGLADQIGQGNETEGFDLAKALLASQGKGTFNNMGDSGTFNVLDGTNELNDIGTSVIGKNNASANQSNAGAKENLAQAVLAGIRGKDIKENGTGGTQGFKIDSSYQSALGDIALDKKGNPMYDPFSGAQKINRNLEEETNFIKWANDNGYKTADSALAAYISQGKPRAGKTGDGGSGNKEKVDNTAAAASIKQQYKDKKITRDQAMKALQKLGYK